MEQAKQATRFADRWSAIRPTKTALFWSCVASAALTMTIGFTWGGWVRGVTAENVASLRAEEAVVKRLAPICVAEFKQDPAREQKLKDLKALDAWKRSDYVKQQGWATMPGDKEGDSRVAEECAPLLIR